MQKTKTFEDTSIANFVFIITPIEAIFTDPNQHKRTLTLEKGMQTLGTLQQSIPIMSKQRGLVHKFQAKSSQVTFRIINDKNLNYQWTVYKVFDGGQLQEIDCMQFCISNFWKNFSNEYEKQIGILNIRTKDDKEHRRIMQAWKDITEQSQQKTAIMRVKFKNANFKLNFNIQARSLLDQQLQEYEKQKNARKQRQFQRSQIRKSALNATFAFMQNDRVDEFNVSDKFKRAKTDEQNKLSIPTANSTNGNILSLNKEHKQGLKKSISHNELKTLSRKKSNNEDGLNSLQISSDMQYRSLKKLNSLEKKDSYQQKDDLSISSRIKHETPKTPKAAAPVQSVFESHKTTVLYVVLGVVMLWMLYNLMHHTPKVQYVGK